MTWLPALPYLAQPAPMASLGVLYSLLTKKVKTQAWFTDGSAQRTGLA